jgi:hypothetical protein
VRFITISIDGVSAGRRLDFGGLRRTLHSIGSRCFRPLLFPASSANSGHRGSRGRVRERLPALVSFL